MDWYKGVYLMATFAEFLPMIITKNNTDGRFFKIFTLRIISNGRFTIMGNIQLCFFNLNTLLPAKQETLVCIQSSAHKFSSLMIVFFGDKT